MELGLGGGAEPRGIGRGTSNLTGGAVSYSEGYLCNTFQWQLTYPPPPPPGPAHPDRGGARDRGCGYRRGWGSG